MKINDYNYLVELKNGNEKALEYVIDKYSPLVNGIASKVLYPLESREIIEECVSDIFISIWNNINKFCGEEEKLRGWIGGVSKYKAIDYYRKHKKERKTISHIDGKEFASEKVLEEDIIKEIEMKKILSLVNLLKEPDKSIFIMKFLYGYSSKKIGEKLGLSISNINTKVSRGREKLRKEYYNEG